MFERRQFLIAASLAGLLPQLSFAASPSDNKLVLIFLRGGLDGLAAVPPHGDPSYRAARGPLALDGPGGILDLDGFFGLHPKLGTMHQLYRSGQLLPIHAVASPYRDRSHFDAQNILENGGTKAYQHKDGWLNRALDAAAATPGAIAIGQNIPVVLQGRNSASSWAPSVLPSPDSDTIDRLMMLYETDQLFADALRTALETDAMIATNDRKTGSRGFNGARNITVAMEAIAKFFAADGGPGIAVYDFGGWDTHANQGRETGQLANRLSQLDGALDILQKRLNALWSKTVVVIATEFGRTVPANGTQGSDHGTGMVTLLAGGAVDGGKTIADWPGLRSGDLYQSRDLKPTIDIRSIFKGVLHDHLSIARAELDSTVFPDSGAIAAMNNLIA